MPYGHPIIALQLIDYDDGDDTWNGSTWEQVSEYLNERMLSFTFSDHEKKKDLLEMTFRNDDYAMLDVPAFAKGQKYLVTWGWPGQTAAPRRMIIISAKGGDPIIVKAHCTLALLDNTKRSRFMEGVTDSEWVRTVAEEYKYQGNLAHIDETNIRHDITQPRWMTDAQMMRKLARKNSFEFYVDAEGLHWHRRRTERDPVRIYFYKGDNDRGAILAPPQFEANLSKGVARVRVKAFDPYLKTHVDMVFGIEDDEAVSLGTEEELGDPDGDIGLRASRISVEEVVPGGLMTEEEALAAAEAIYRNTAKKRYKMSMPIIGDALLGAKQIIGVYGMVDVFDGLYYIVEGIHSIGAGKYTLALKCEKDALGRASSKKKTKKKAPNKNEAGGEPAEASDELKKMLTTITTPDGAIVPAYIFTGDGGATGQTSELTPAGFNALSQKQKEVLAQQGAQSALPDA